MFKHRLRWIKQAFTVSQVSMVSLADAEVATVFMIFCCLIELLLYKAGTSLSVTWYPHRHDKNCMLESFDNMLPKSFQG